MDCGTTIPSSRKAADKREKHEPVWKNSGRFLKPFYTRRCKGGLKTEADYWTQVFANPETRVSKKWVHVLCPSARWPCYAKPSYPGVPGRRADILLPLRNVASELLRAVGSYAAMWKVK